MPSNMRKMRSFKPYCAKYHPGICSPFILSVVSIFFVLGSEGSDQTARMCRLIWTFAVRIGPNTRFRMAWPICCWSAVLILNATGHPRRMKAISNV